MALTIKAKFKNGKNIIKNNFIENWFSSQVINFLKNNEVVIDSIQLYDVRDCENDYEKYYERQDNEFCWYFIVTVNDKKVVSDYANDYEYYTSYMDELLSK